MNNVPEEWFVIAAKTLFDKNKEKTFYSHDLTTYTENVLEYIKSDFNSNWWLDRKHVDNESIKSFILGIIIHQCDPFIHPLTCGVDSGHDLLVPRVDCNGNKYLICPSCGYVQTNTLRF